MTDGTADILLVEDSADDALFFTHALDEAGLPARVQTARDGAEALAVIFGAENPAEAAPLVRPRMIVLDLNLPKVSGLELLRRLKANPHTRTIPIVILSSPQEKRDLAESYQSGANSYLVKPMDFDEFAGLVHTLDRYWLRHNRTPKT